MSKRLQQIYSMHKQAIQEHMRTYVAPTEQAQYAEFLFCTITPQSNGKKCWEAIQILQEKRPRTHAQIAAILKGRARFHNTKARRLMQAKDTWKKVKSLLEQEKDPLQLRNAIEDTVDGYGFKEASHFIRNIGLSRSKVAILDRHILRNLKEFGAIDTIDIKGKKGYLQLEQQALAFAEKVSIPMDELDVLFWHMTHGEFFK